MDIQDVSSIGEYASMVQQALANAERAGRRKGEIPKGHRPAFIQVRTHMTQYEFLLSHQKICAFVR